MLFIQFIKKIRLLIVIDNSHLKYVISSHYFRGVVAVSMDIRMLDIDQCPDKYHVPNAFKDTHKCDDKSSYVSSLNNNCSLHGKFYHGIIILSVYLQRPVSTFCLRCSCCFWIIFKCLNLFNHLNMFTVLHWQCVPILGRGFVTGGYKCECKQGYEYPFEDPITYYDGQLVEAEFISLVEDKETRYICV